MTEEIKKEADEVYRKYYDIWIKSDMTINLDDFIKIVIQDRQSALNLAKLAVQTSSDEHDDFWQKEIHSLTQQIEYLKSKL